MVSNNSADNDELVRWWMQREDAAATVTEILNKMAGPLGTDQMSDTEFWRRAGTFALPDDEGGHGKSS